LLKNTPFNKCENESKITNKTLINSIKKVEKAVVVESGSDLSKRVRFGLFMFGFCNSESGNWLHFEAWWEGFQQWVVEGIIGQFDTRWK
jgi:hypothetical protein